MRRRFGRRTRQAAPSDGGRRIVIVGSPNVGKSLIFTRLTGAYAVVSNYPGTTVEVFRGWAHVGGERYEVIDTPGMYSLLPVSEEELVARRILLSDRPDAVLHVADAKNLERMLLLTLQLIEARLPVILVLNIIDEAERLGMAIDVPRLERELRAPVCATDATTGRGVDALRGRIEEYVSRARMGRH
ncbi:MAG: FeoB small GTPase domain-containing protein [bacterium]|nr:FeoB small GTPase domain-containing protein [bacterium]